jgi:hypothetical protein
MAEDLASLNIRSISTGPSPAFAVALARPLSTARAAEAAAQSYSRCSWAPSPAAQPSPVTLGEFGDDRVGAILQQIHRDHHLCLIHILGVTAHLTAT